MANLNHLTRVLVCEDEALILMDIEAVLLDAGVGTVLSAVSVDEAMKIIESDQVDAAVLDLHLGQSGWSYDLAHRLQTKGVPFVFSSGTVEVADGFRTIPLVTKPFSEAQLISALLQVSVDQETEAAQ